VLSAILTLSATNTALGGGVSLLAIYSLGLGLPFLLAAAFTGHFLPRLRAMRYWTRRLQIGAGALLIVMGVAMVTGYLSAFAAWLLKVFPSLGLIG